MLATKRVLVIMPFSQTTDAHTEMYWARHFNSYLKPLIAEVEGAEPVRCEPLSDGVAQQIIMNLVNSDIVVADITDQDPDVLWELGVRQSFRQSTIVISEAGTNPPFQFSLRKGLSYNGDYLDNRDFEEKIKAALQACMASPVEADSPVLETFGGRSTLYGIMHDNENLRRIEGLQMEITVNETLLGQIFDNCVRNKALRAANRAESKKMTTTPLKTAALEFLLINRYLPLDKAFYATAYVCDNFFQAINSHLVEWESTASDKEAEDWLMGCKESTYKNVAKLKENLQQAKATLHA